MADRTSAGILGLVFELLAEGKSKKQMVKALWRARQDYDFSDDQMDADEALIQLGLAEECKVCGATVYDGEDHEEYCDGDWE